ncbi:hypothetical protein RhiirA1_472182 [Rhizophagus irregularis]|uniref:Uncharacterized protein n=1 Tax=Rhizophagus irregularis TaxID=588596 RepID=A0A2I1F9Q4_9GLOM|nr:hypothetical protein RhiirA1_472182 [Rhizophagus irregularis]PKY31098.1 hypothetical protein RhiirB3_448527 [Rhizophagus irregularis]
MYKEGKDEVKENNTKNNNKNNSLIIEAEKVVINGIIEGINDILKVTVEALSNDNDNNNNEEVREMARRKSLVLSKTKSLSEIIKKTASVLTTKVDGESSCQSSRQSSRQPPSRQPPSRQSPSHQPPSRQPPSRQPPSRQPPSRQLPPRQLSSRLPPSRLHPSRSHTSRQPNSRQPNSRQTPSRQTPLRHIPSHQTPRQSPSRQYPQYPLIQPSSQSPIRCIYCSEGHWIIHCPKIPKEYRGLCVNCWASDSHQALTCKSKKRPEPWS